eukprot:519657-Prymnesium_polylepis.1
MVDVEVTHEEAEQISRLNRAVDGGLVIKEPIGDLQSGDVVESLETHSLGGRTFIETLSDLSAYGVRPTYRLSVRRPPPGLPPMCSIADLLSEVGMEELLPTLCAGGVTLARVAFDVDDKPRAEALDALKALSVFATLPARQKILGALTRANREGRLSP